MKISIIFCVLLSSCGVLNFDKDTTVEQKSAAIHDAAREAIAITLMEVFEDSERLKEAQKIKEWTNEFVLDGLLVQNPTAAVEIAEHLFESMPPKYVVYMKTVINLLRIYIEQPDVSELVDANNYRMVMALFQGISDGCQSIIDYEFAN